MKTPAEIREMAMRLADDAREALASRMYEGPRRDVDDIVRECRLLELLAVAEAWKEYVHERQQKFPDPIYRSVLFERGVKTLAALDAKMGGL